MSSAPESWGHCRRGHTPLLHGLIVDRLHIVGVLHRDAGDAEAGRPRAQALQAGHLTEVLGDGEEVVLDDHQHR